MLQVRKKVFFTIILSVALLAVIIIMLALNKSGETGQTTEDPVQTTHQTESTAPQEPERSTEPSKQPAEAVVPSVQMDLPLLAETFKNDFSIGAALEPNQTSGLSADLMKKQVNMLVAENAMKPASIQPVEGHFNWDQADQIVAFTKENGMAVRFHTLVWHNQYRIGSFWTRMANRWWMRPMPKSGKRIRSFCWTDWMLISGPLLVATRRILNIGMLLMKLLSLLIQKACGTATGIKLREPIILRQPSVLQGRRADPGLSCILTIMERMTRRSGTVCMNW
ncbi:hypothetical protein QFZ80_003310 [Paenibacillus sp. V4I7]|nr:hypothetical protein [Paenibacillus sp. V4I7]